MRRSPLSAVFLSLAVQSVASAQPLQGFVDMHTHPMSHLGFGGVLVYGAPDDQTPMVKWFPVPPLFTCFNTYEPSGPVTSSFSNCNHIHGSWGLYDNLCGDVIRNAIVDKIERVYQAEFPNPGVAGLTNDHPHVWGASPFTWWPHWSSVTHQQMRWEWIRRAFEGGQRVMVALAVNNSVLAKASNAPRLVDDRASVLNQLQELEAFVGRHSDFMAIARTSAELRDIIASNRLAVVMGVETDDFGNLSRRARFGGETITSTQVNAEIDALYAAGARYILPVHFSNSLLGGYAINDDLFVLDSKEYLDEFPTVVETCGQGVRFNVDRANFSDGEATLLRSRDLGRIIDHQPDWTAADAGCGHQNALGLTPLGTAAVRRMMDLGMIIDIDHMSRRMVDGVVALARSRNYPLNSGHNGPLAADCATGSTHPDHCNENVRTREQYEAIRSLGGMVGLGHGGRATNFVQAYRQVHEWVGNRPVAIGTDVNGLEAMPAPDPLAPVSYTSIARYNYPAGRAWDLNVDGFAHYGLFPDYIRAWQVPTGAAYRMTNQELESFMTSAEGFARMWARSEQRSVGAPYSGTVSRATVWCTHSGARLVPGDFNGDGAMDLACRDSRFFWFDLANRWGALDGVDDGPALETTFCTGTNDRLLTGDFNGDGRTDLFCHRPTGYDVSLNVPPGTFGGYSSRVSTVRCTHAGATLNTADVNGDGRTDLVCTDPDEVWVEWADVNGAFQGVWDASLLGTTPFCPVGAALHLADLNADGRAEMICRDGTTLRVKFALSTGNYSTSTRIATSSFCTHSGTTASFDDVNGDGRADWVCRGAAGWMWIDYAGLFGEFDGSVWSADTGFCEGADQVSSLLDVNGDNREDLVCKSPTSLQVRYATLTGTF